MSLWRSIRWEASDRIQGLLWRGRCFFWKIGNLVMRAWEWTRLHAKLVFYRRRVIDVDFDPNTGTLTSNEPLPPGATLQVGFVIAVGENPGPISVCKITQWELRSWPAACRALWMKATRKAKGPLLRLSVNDIRPHLKKDNK